MTDVPSHIIPKAELAEMPPWAALAYEQSSGPAGLPLKERGVSLEMEENKI